VRCDNDSLSSNIKCSTIHKIAKILAILSQFNNKEMATTNCGLFVIAFAIHLANNKDPSECHYDLKELRKHFC